MILNVALVKIRMSIACVFPFSAFHRQKEKNNSSTWKPSVLIVDRERYAPSFLPELITKPQPPLGQQNQWITPMWRYGRHSFWISILAFCLKTSTWLSMLWRSHAAVNSPCCYKNHLWSESHGEGGTVGWKHHCCRRALGSPFDF